MDKEYLQNLIKELIEKLAIPVKEVSILDSEPGTSWFKVEVGEPHFFTAHDGEALMALNHLARKIAENKAPRREEEVQFLIDINDFQKKKVDSVRALAHMMAERARYFKSSVEVNPMSAFERRIVHEFLASETDLKTESIGMGPARRVVIKYLGAI
jgi:predicted RNA-binding protein Jag